MKKSIWSILIFILVGAGMAYNEFEDGQRITFTVKDLRTGETYLLGDEEITVKDDVVTKVTRYLSLDGQDVQVERSVYDFESLLLRAYDFKNIQTGENVKLQTTDKIGEIEVNDKSKGEPRKGTYIWKNNTYMAKPLHHVIVRNWDRIVSKKAFTFNLMVPSKMDCYGFRIKQTGLIDDKGQRLHRLRLEPDSWVARRFVGPMDFYYSSDKLLVKYEGVTTAAIEGNPDKLVRIDFSYVDPASE